jgi:hypothetical protein
MSDSEDHQGMEFNQGMDSFEEIKIQRLEDALKDVAAYANGVIRTKINNIAFDPQGRIVSSGPRCEFVKLPNITSRRSSFWIGYQFMMPDFYQSREVKRSDYTVAKTDSSSVRVAASPDKGLLTVGQTPFTMRVLDLKHFKKKQYENLGLTYEDVNDVISTLKEHEELVKDTVCYEFMQKVGEYILAKNQQLNFADTRLPGDKFEGSIENIIERLKSPEFRNNLIERAINQYETVTNVKENLLKTVALLEKYGGINSKEGCYETALRFFTEQMTIDEVVNPNFWDNMSQSERAQRIAVMYDSVHKDFFE